MLYVEDLDRMHCTNPLCEHRDHRTLILHSRCHPQIPTWATYDREQEAVVITCAVCATRLTTIAVARRPRPGKAPHA
jgi:hypothetical protein